MANYELNFEIFDSEKEARFDHLRCIPTAKYLLRSGELFYLQEKEVFRDQANLKNDPFQCC